MWNDTSQLFLDPSFLLPQHHRSKDMSYGTLRITHPSQWRFKAEVITEVYDWCFEFEAHHPTWGRVALSGNEMTACSRAAFEAFWALYGDHMSMMDYTDI